MSNPAIKARGILIQRGDGGTPESFTTIPGRTGFSGPDGQGTSIITTDMDSTAEEKIMDMFAAGRINLSLNFNPDNAVHQALLSDQENMTLRNFKIVFVSGTYWSFAAYVLSLPTNAATGAAFTATATLDISGVITRTTI